MLSIAASFEFFPPSTELMQRRLRVCVQELTPLRPEFVSVTYGAGGGTRERTHATVCDILDEGVLDVAAHLTCVGASRDEVDAVLDRYRQAGVRRLVLLRGDMPEGPGSLYLPHPRGYENAAALVEGASRIGNFTSYVASYPETHPDSLSLLADMDNLKRKVDAGASAAITQFFLEPDLYFRHIETVRAHGIEIPVIPGVMLQSNFAGLVRMAEKCGARVPRQMRQIFTGASSDRSEALAIDWNVELVERLVAGGAEHVHFYTLNRSDMTLAVCGRLGLAGLG